MQLLIKNAKLREQDTLTDIAVDKGVIVEIAPNLSYPAETVVDAGGALVTPSLIDPHIHLDKVNIFDVVRKNVSVITSYSIHYTKLYDDEQLHVGLPPET